jgi:hypothetical protein
VDRLLELLQVLVGQDEAEPIFPGLLKYAGQAQGGEVLDVVYI